MTAAPYAPVVPGGIRDDDYAFGTAAGPTCSRCLQPHDTPEPVTVYRREAGPPAERWLRYCRRCSRG